MPFAQLGLQAELLRAIAARGYTRPTPIQAQAVPVVLQGRDVLAGAQTGTGKTAAFALPILQLFSDRPRQVIGNSGAPRALVLTPTRELAAQVGESIDTYGAHLKLRSAVIFGGVSINPQKQRLHHGIDILVATPGRLLDHTIQRSVDLSAIEILVLDEADRMLDMGFIHDIRKVLALLPRRRQNLLFSATYTQDIKRLADRLLHRPALIEVAPASAAAESVAQCVYRVSKDAKRDLLIHLIDDGQWQQVLVFTRTKHGANRLAKQLIRAGINAAAIHGNKSQGARTAALADFKSGRVRVLVATDIAARGLDIDRLPHVVNYELPDVPEHYVHRIGRTGRAGKEGTAVSLVGNEEVKLLEQVRRLLKNDIPVLPMPHFKPRVLQSMPECKPQVKGKSATERNLRAGGAHRRGRSHPDVGTQASADVSRRPKRKRRSRSRSRRAADSSR